MPTSKQIVLGFALAAGILSSGRVFADRAPTPDERFRIESVLRNEGFTHWRKIKLDDGLWEVEDAYASDNRKYELKLNPDTLAIISRKTDGFADRVPTAEERSRIASTLRDAGFTNWRKIKLDDGLWEVEDAYASDGSKYELKLNPDTLAIVRRKPD
jgi:hypothetical protein